MNYHCLSLFKENQVGLFYKMNHVSIHIHNFAHYTFFAIPVLLENRLAEIRKFYKSGLKT